MVYGKKARKYMQNWIMRTDRVAIFSRDLSWVDDTIKKLLEDKAIKNELIICVPKHTDLTQELKRKNAKILTYDVLNYEPQSRFTIAGYGKGGACVAIAHTSAQYHIIEEYAGNEHPAYCMAMDIVEILKGMECNQI
jgi:hypothetical protein